MKKAKIWDARQLPAFLTPKEYSALMGIDQKTVQKMCRAGVAERVRGASAGAESCTQNPAEKRKARPCWNTDEP